MQTLENEMTKQPAKFAAGDKVKVSESAAWLSNLVGVQGKIGIAHTYPREGRPPVWAYSVWFENGQRVDICEHDLRPAMLCECGSLLSAVTFTCVRGDYCSARGKQ